MKYVLITGFPHSGTSILKCVLSGCSNVYTHPYETFNITEEIHDNAKKEKKDIILIKKPFLPAQLMNINSLRVMYKNPNFKDMKIILILRNPFFVLSSIKRRFGEWNKNPTDHDFETYQYTAKLFYQIQKENIKNIYCIKYEDIFLENYINIKSILNDLKLIYTDDIFITTNKNNKNINGYLYDKYSKKPLEANHNDFRVWQINQKFENMNYPEKIDLDEKTIHKINYSKIIQKLYKF